MYRTPSSNRLHIGIFGRRNVGKSSLINALSGQDIAIVSEVAGTTTDPVYKAMEILPIGPCLLIDTAGLDDQGELGEQRVKRSLQVLRRVDVVIIVIDPRFEIGSFELDLLQQCRRRKLPFLFVLNKCDLEEEFPVEKYLQVNHLPYLKISARSHQGIEELKQKIISLAPLHWSPIPLVADLIDEKDVLVLVCPIDQAMPQGRLILPQVQVLREILDCNASGFVCKETELDCVLKSLKSPPRLVICDSQVFEIVQDIVPPSIPLTSFSVLFARHKGDLNAFLEGVVAIERLQDKDEILIAEACTHHVQPVDIGRSKIPTWLMNYTQKELHYDVVSGGDFPADLSRYKLIISCGGCMVNRQEILFRIEKAKANNVPITNYGVLIAYLSGILPRVVMPLRGGIEKIVLPQEMLAGKN